MAGNPNPRTDHIAQHQFSASNRMSPGRPKRLLKRVDEILHELGLHPAKELLKLMPELAATKRADLWMELMRYTCTPPKEFFDDVPAPLPKQELIARAKEAISQLEKEAA